MLRVNVPVPGGWGRAATFLLMSGTPPPVSKLHVSLALSDRVLKYTSRERSFSSFFPSLTQNYYIGMDSCVACLLKGLKLIWYEKNINGDGKDCKKSTSWWVLPLWILLVDVWDEWFVTYLAIWVIIICILIWDECIHVTSHIIDRLESIAELGFPLDVNIAIWQHTFGLFAYTICVAWEVH